MLAALSDVAGTSWSPDEEEAWRVAIHQISEAMLAGAERLG
jgi:hypothetical protein